MTCPNSNSGLFSASLSLIDKICPNSSKPSFISQALIVGKNIDVSDAFNSNIYAVFLQHMARNGRILDVGCGSGRDALYFTQQGLSVDAFDSAQELVALARIRTRLPNDGFWACASLLHCKRERLPEVFQRLIRAL